MICHNILARRTNVLPKHEMGSDTDGHPLQKMKGEGHGPPFLEAIWKVNCYPMFLEKKESPAKVI